MRIYDAVLQKPKAYSKLDLRYCSYYTAITNNNNNNDDEGSNINNNTLHAASNRN